MLAAGGGARAIQNSIPPLACLAMGIMRDRLIARGEAGPRRRVGENLVDEFQNLGRRAPRGEKRLVHERLLGLGRQALEMLAVDVELGRIGALEAEDGLLLVADREDGARCAASRGLAGEEFLGQLVDDGPLFGAGVLGFVDQNMVDAIVELVEHPLRGMSPRSRSARVFTIRSS